MVEENAGFLTEKQEQRNVKVLEHNRSGTAYRALTACIIWL